MKLLLKAWSEVAGLFPEEEVSELRELLYDSGMFERSLEMAPVSLWSTYSVILGSPVTRIPDRWENID